MKVDSILNGRREVQPQPNPSDDILRRIASAISGVRFGSVEVVI